MRYQLYLSLIFGFLCLIACKPDSKSDSKSADSIKMESAITVPIRYAQGFTVTYFDNYTAVEVRDPWDSTRLLQRYLLIDRNLPRPKHLPKGTVVPVPLKNIVVYTSVHAAIIDQLEATDQIIGVCEPRYMDSPAIHAGLKEGRIADLGEATAPNVERMIEIGTEVVVASPFQNSSYGPVEKIGVPIIEGADYMESLPLGRTEWIRFYGLLLGRSAQADSIFKETEQSYLSLKELTSSVKRYPSVLTEKRYGSSWYIPAGDSYMAHLFKDAGANYLFKDLPGSGSTPLAFETVLDKASHAEYWLIKYNLPSEMNYQELRAEYTPYEHFDAFKNRQIYSCNTGEVPYYEEFPLHPDFLLKDLIWVFHPELLPEYTPRYYKRMRE